MLIYSECWWFDCCLRLLLCGAQGRGLATAADSKDIANGRAGLYTYPEGHISRLRCLCACACTCACACGGMESIGRCQVDGCDHGTEREAVFALLAHTL
jgi:hypothetical protein